MRHVRKLLWIVVGAYVVATVALFVGQRRLLYARGPAKPLWGEVHRLSTGVAVLESGRDPQVVWFHGNGGQLGTMKWVPSGLGLPVRLVEYPGYGDSPGSPTEASILATAREALGDRNSWVCLGQSLGTGVAIAMAAEGRCARLILVSPYTSMPEVAAEHYWVFPVRWLTLDTWDSRTRARQVTVPTLVVHGDHDEVVPYAMGQEIAGIIPGARLETFRGRGHNNLFSKRFWALLRTFAQEPV